jgi:hypothetical protein
VLPDDDIHEGDEPTQRTRPLPEDSIEAAQRTILETLLDSYPAHLSEDELAHVVGRPIDTRDALCELEAAGLIHTRQGFFWATRPAYHFAALGYSNY